MNTFTALRWLVGVILISVVLGSCRTKTKPGDENEVVTDSIAQTNPVPTDLNSDQSELFNTVVGSAEGGIIRGISFGDPVSKVRAGERFEMFEDTTDHIGFTHDTEQLETIDVQYFHANNRISRITVDVYLNSPRATQQLWNTARRNFTERFGTPRQESAKSITWEKSPAQVVIEDVSVGKDFGLKMTFVPSNKTVFASNR
ncbi:hypothetical protein [Telluribacter sp.]|jgi:hypothetical protein|uniref:hypothetical protein n=1 Tax=Telluribacter sp. TaxID=1978767 RepID=UPI002E14DD07|nr:hypothetical protein [Telluribacter sp.]